MTLSERLEAARRRVAKPAPTATNPVTMPTDTGGDGNAKVTELNAPAAWRQPGPCPACGGPGHIDMVDLVGGHARQSCNGCGHSWMVDRK